MPVNAVIKGPSFPIKFQDSKFQVLPLTQVPSNKNIFRSPLNVDKPWNFDFSQLQLTFQPGPT